MEPFYPLHVWVCESCFLVQLEEYVTPEDIFTEYAYFSSYASSWVEHAEKYVAAQGGRISQRELDVRITNVLYDERTPPRSSRANGRTRGEPT